jgi:uncharacterized Zn finger protein
LSISTDQLVRQANTMTKAKAIAAELRKGGEYKAFIALDRPFSITKELYDANDRFIGETTYQIDLTATPRPTCSCPDFEKHGDYCKHIWGIQYALDIEAQEEAQEKQAALFAADYDLMSLAMMEADAIDSDLRGNYGVCY